MSMSENLLKHYLTKSWIAKLINIQINSVDSFIVMVTNFFHGLKNIRIFLDTCFRGLAKVSILKSIGNFTVVEFFFK